MEVKTFLLVDGTELIGEFLGETGMGYRVKRPLRVAAMRGPDGQTHLGFAMWGMTRVTDDEFELFNHALMSTPLGTIPEVAQSYIQQVSGIAVPASSTGQIITG